MLVLDKCASFATFLSVNVGTVGMNFDAVCRRASGRRAYNRRRRLARQRRIAQIIAFQAREPGLTGRELAARLRVHESTVRRDLKAVARIREEWRRFMAEHGPDGRTAPRVARAVRGVSL
jgi:IS30 family transposase